MGSITRLSQATIVRGCLFVLCVVVGYGPVVSFAQEIGEVVSVQGDERVFRAGEPVAVPLRARLALSRGDRIVTGELGGTSVLLGDATQLRLHRNTELLLEELRSEAEPTTSFSIARGAFWARAKSVFRGVAGVIRRATVRSPPVVNVRTPTIAIGIRGTDWYVRVDPVSGTSQVVLIDGSADLSNEFGAVKLAAGEEAIVRPGQAPVKRVIVDLQDRPLIALEFDAEWLDLLRITGLSSNRARNALEADSTRLDRASLAYDGRLYGQANTLLDASSRSSPRKALLGALLQARAGQLNPALEALKTLARSNDSTVRLQAALARSALLLSMDELQSAQNVFNASSLASPEAMQSSDWNAFNVVFAFLKEDWDAGLKAARAAARRFPGDARFEVLSALALLLAGRTEEMRSAIESALERDAEEPSAWHARGIFYQYVEPDANKAIESYQRAVELEPRQFQSWNNLALVFIELGRFEIAKRDLARAAELAEGRAVVQANLGAFAQLVDRLDDAEAHFERALALEPDHPGALIGRGYTAMARGEFAAARQDFLRAITANPIEPGGNVALAGAYYQNGEEFEANQAIDKALRTDPDDAVTAQVAMTMALDQLDVKRAIPLAKRALNNALKSQSFAVENLASSRNGATSVGAAFSTLGLTEWASYYAHLGSSPYLANNYFLLSSVYAPRGITATNGALNQALTLEPTAISTSNRGLEIVKAPRLDLTTAASFGDQRGASSRSIATTFQGYDNTHSPVSFRLDFNKSSADGLRQNSDSRTQTLNFSIGTRLDDRRHHFMANIFSSETETGRPGATTDNDPDDIDRFDALSASLSYHARLDFDNRVLVRAAYDKRESRFVNGSPLGTGLESRLFSLLLNFGETFTRNVVDQGLVDLNVLGAPCTPTNPCVGFGAGLAGLFPAINDTLPATIDFDSIATTTTTTKGFGFQFRHLFSVDDLDITYGVEAFPHDRESIVESNTFDITGSGLLTDLVNFFNFVAIENRTVRAETETDRLSTFGYMHGRWNISESLAAEAGLFGEYFDDDVEDSKFRLNPRVGLAWRPSENHWLRAAYQERLGMTTSALGPLAPVATVGLVSPTNELLDGASSENLQVQWDAEWTSRLFTSMRLERQRFDEWFSFVSPTPIIVDKASVTTVDVGLNAWLLDYFGLFARYQFTDSKNESTTNAGNDLPLKPRHGFSTGVNFVHPSRWVMSASATFIGRRYSDLANLQPVAGVWTGALGTSWESRDRAFRIGVNVTNVLDRRFEVARGFPAARRTGALSVEARF